jgi:hypothetical protein
MRAAKRPSLTRLVVAPPGVILPLTAARGSLLGFGLPPSRAGMIAELAPIPGASASLQQEEDAMASPELQARPAT